MMNEIGHVVRVRAAWRCDENNVFWTFASERSIQWCSILTWYRSRGTILIWRRPVHVIMGDLRTSATILAHGNEKATMNCNSRWVARLSVINHRYAGVTDESGLRTNPYWQENLPTDSDGKGLHFHVLHHRSCMEGKSLTWFMNMVTCGRNLRAALLSFGTDCRPQCKCKQDGIDSDRAP